GGHAACVTGLVEQLTETISEMFVCLRESVRVGEGANRPAEPALNFRFRIADFRFDVRPIEVHQARVIYRVRTEFGAAFLQLAHFVPSQEFFAVERSGWWREA